MQPILPTSSAVSGPGFSAGPAATIARTPLDLASDLGRASHSSPAAPSATSGALLRDVQNALGQLLGGAGNQGTDKLLQMMVALLILLALLEQMNGAGERSGGQAAQLPQTSSEGSYVMMSAMTTSISIEQTSVYMATGTGSAPLMAQPGGAPAGSQIDLVG
jgi:hypothetical protein